MEGLNLLIAEMLIQERQHETTMRSHVAPVRPRSRGGVKHALATTFVRLGLRLDPAAGEGVRTFSATLVRQERGC
jgi:hypothetical protein